MQGNSDPIMFIFVVLGLLVCSEARVTPVFVQTGKDLLLDVKEVVTLREGHDFTWIVNSKTTIVRQFHGGKPEFFGSYKSRADFFVQNHSLLLKNVQPSDSGVYTAFFYSGSVTVVAAYEVTVQDQVSPVELTVKSCSSDLSNLEVICRTLISSTFTCRNQTCSHDRGEGTTPGAPLDVYLKGGSVICSHSNQVSSGKDIKNIEDLCGKTPESHSGSALSPCMLKIIVVSVGLFIMVCAVISVHVFESLKKKE